MARVTPLGLDLAFRTRGERGWLRVAHYGRVVGRLMVRGGALSLGAAVITAFIFAGAPPLAMVFAVIGLLAVPIGFAVRILGLVASIPPRTARVLQLHRWSQARGASDGRVVLRGSVKALRTVTTLTGTPAVFVHTHAIGKGRGTDIAYGEDFLVVDDSPIPARISVRHALLVDSPTRVSGSWSSVPLVALPVLPHLLTSTSIKEAVIFPGEQVEVIGHLDTVVDPSVADRLGRQPPLVRVFYGTPESPLLLRTLRPESPIAPA